MQTIRANLDLDLVRTFVTISEAGSCSRAATALNLSAPTVSLQMKRLEEALARELFYKDGRGRELTDGGRAFLASARKLLEMNDLILLETKPYALTGRIRIGATEEFAEDRLPALLRQFAGMNPGVRVDLLIDVNLKLHAALAAGELDLALIAQDPASPREGALLFEEPLIWIAADDFLLEPAKPLPLVLFTEPCLVRSLVVREIEARRIDYRIVCTSPSLAGLRAAVQAGLGVTVRTRGQVGAGTKEIVGQRLLPKLPSLKLFVFTRSRVLSGDHLLLHMKSLLVRTFGGAGFRGGARSN
jgi:DNA-binding transcriptional LysR family regulator